MTESDQPHCYHCQLPIRGKVQFFAQINHQAQPMCCPGCLAVAQAIDAGGLASYYQFRSEAAPQAEGVDNEALAELKLYDLPEIQADFVLTELDEQGRRVSEATLLVEGITCAACAWLIEQHLDPLDAIDWVGVNLSRHTLRIRWYPEQTTLSELLAALTRIGYHARPYHPDRQAQLAEQERRQAIRRLAVSGIGMMQVMMFAIALYAGAFQGMEPIYRDLLRWVSLVVATPVVLFAAAPFFQTAWRDLRNKHLSMDVPVALAIGSAYSASIWATVTGAGEVYFDSVSMFTFLLLLGRFVEMQSRQRLGLSGNKLRTLLPASAEKWRDGHYLQVPLAALKVGDQVRVRPGHSIPADGEILSGISAIDESAITGENLPVRRQPGDFVTGGSLNTEQALIIRVQRTGKQARLAAIVRLLERAQGEKPPAAQFSDQVARYFIAAVLLLAVAIYSYWSHADPANAFWITLSVLVVTCPCALSLATPTALTCATEHLHQQGLLITRGHVLEGLGQITRVVFDKTGTLTQGKLSLVQTLSLTAEPPEHHLQIAAALEQSSEHPIARAFPESTLQLENEHNHIGQGVSGQLTGRIYRLGTPDFACSQPPKPPSSSGQWLLLSADDQPTAWFELRDSLRLEAKATLEALQQMGLKTELLSGDTQHSVEQVAKTLQVDAFLARQSPEDKLAHIKALQADGEQVLMVGDGINDLPVLAQANISVAMGNATDLAKTSADAILLCNHLSRLPLALNVAARTRTVIRQNIGWALGYNLLALPLAAAGLIPPWLAATGMASSSLLVVSNALRITRFKSAAGQPKTCSTTEQKSPA